MTTFAEVLEGTTRIPFSDTEVQRMNDVLARDQRDGGDLRWGAAARLSDTHSFPDGEADPHAAADGLIVISSPTKLEQTILFVKVDGGRTFLGRQKPHYYSFVTPFEESDAERDWLQGGVFYSWRLATKAIAHIGPLANHFRAEDSP